MNPWLLTALWAYLCGALLVIVTLLWDIRGRLVAPTSRAPPPPHIAEAYPASDPPLCPHCEAPTDEESAPYCPACQNFVPPF